MSSGQCRRGRRRYCILLANGSFQYERHRAAGESRHPSNRQMGAVARILSRVCMPVLGSRFTHPEMLMCLPGVSMLVWSLIYRQAFVLPRSWRFRPESFDFTSAIMEFTSMFSGRTVCADQPCKGTVSMQIILAKEPPDSDGSSKQPHNQSPVIGKITKQSCTVTCIQDLLFYTNIIMSPQQSLSIILSWHRLMSIMSPALREMPC